MEQYWEVRVEFILALKDGTVATLAPPTSKKEKQSIIGARTPSEESNDKKLAVGPLIEHSSTPGLSWMACAIQTILFAIGPLSQFDPCVQFIAHL